MALLGRGTGQAGQNAHHVVPDIVRVLRWVRLLLITRHVHGKLHKSVTSVLIVDLRYILATHGH